MKLVYHNVNRVLSRCIKGKQLKHTVYSYAHGVYRVLSNVCYEIPRKFCNVPTSYKRLDVHNCMQQYVSAGSYSDYSDNIVKVVLPLDTVYIIHYDKVSICILLIIINNMFYYECNCL